MNQHWQTAQPPVHPTYLPPQYPPPAYYPPQVVVVQHGRRRISRVEHLGHLALTLCTLGLWAPVWLIRAIAGR